MKPGLFTFLEKTAASVDQLQAGLRRLKAVKVPLGRGAIIDRGNPVGGLQIPRPPVEKALNHLAGSKDQIIKDNITGKILLPKGGSVPQLSSPVNNFQSLSGDAKRVVNIATGLHEGAERAVKPNQVAPMSGHFSPLVLLKDHNLLSKMTGPGAEEGRAAIRGLMNSKGETRQLRTSFENKYGPRSLQFLEEGQKVPSAMRKNFANSANSYAKTQAEERRAFQEQLRSSGQGGGFGAPALSKSAAVQSQPQHEEFLDNHFSLSPQWKTFKKKLRSQSFVEAVRQDTRSDDKLKRYSEANGKHLRARGVPTFPVPSQSSNKDYTVKFHPEDQRFSCNCGDWIHVRSHQVSKPRQDCKHIWLVKNELKQSGTDIQSMVKKAAQGRAALSLMETYK